MDESGIPNPTKDAPRERTGAAPTVPETGQSITPWLMVVPVVVCFSGGLFGYDHVISGAPHGFKVTFWLFAMFCALAWIWIYFRVPETKGQSLEQIQELWKAVS